MKSIFNSIIMAVLIYLMSTAISCEKMLEVELPDNQMLSETVFSDTQTANAVLSGLYAGLWESSPVTGYQSGRLLGLYTDDLTYYAVNATNGLPELSNNTQIDSNQFILAKSGSSVPFAVFKATSKNSVFIVKLADGNTTIGYFENGNIVVDIPQTDGRYSKEVFTAK